MRKEWGELSHEERKSYIAAIQCMRSIPSILDLPGTKSLYDDVAAVHINATMAVHASGSFLSWHRHSLWLWEQLLRNECGYDGYQPYWNWALSAGNLSGSPLFDGSETSLSGNGEPKPDRIPYIVGGVPMPVGTGGGCVMNGPFANMTLNLGPFEFAQTLPPNWGDWTPHCLYRDFNDWGAARYTNQSSVDRLFTLENIVELQDAISSSGVEKGVHTGGHYAVGGVMFDLFASPQDPVFMLHHAMVDRVWTKWQALDPDSRRFSWDGTNTIYNAHTTAKVDKDTLLHYGILGRAMRLEEVADTMAFEYCYTYT